MRLSILVFAASAAALAAPACAGTVMTSETVGDVLPNGKSMLYLEPDRVRIETTRGVIIFRADQNTAYMLNPALKAFTRLTSDTLAQIAAAAKVDPGRPVKFEFRKAGGTASYGNWSCEGVEQLLDGKPYAQLCVAPLSALGLGDNDLGAARGFESFMRPLAPGIAASPSGIDPRAFEEVIGYPGFAVHMKVLDSDIEMTTQSVERKTLEASLFDVPAGYREEPPRTLPPLH